jgi:hypothetical protein
MTLPTYSNNDPTAITAIYLRTTEHKPFWSVDKTGDDEHDRYKNLKRTASSSPVLTHHNVEVFKSKLYGGEVFWAHKDEHLIYESDVKFPTVVLNSTQGKVPYQASVWRSHDHPETAGIPALVFWKLFESSPLSMIASDVEQSREGRAFWQYRVKEALAKGLQVCICLLGDSSSEHRRKVTATLPVRELKDLKQAYSTDQGKGLSSFLLIRSKP